MATNAPTSGDGVAFSSLATPRGSGTPPSAGGGNIFSSMASLLGLQLEDTFFCQICLDDALVSQSHTLSTCGHRFCASCLQSYLAFHIQEGETDVKCFFQAIGPSAYAEEPSDLACLTSIPPEEIQQLVDARTFARFKRFRFNKQHSNARQCPYCDHSQLCDGNLSSDAMQCTCASCKRVFCFVHGNAHPAESCRLYTKRTRTVEQQNLVVINRLCKACPGCGQLVEKDGGCHQIKCWACKTSFCWLCREVIDGAAFPMHYQWWNVGGCAGSHATSVDTDEDDATTCERRMLAASKGLLVVVFGPPTFVLAVLCSVVCCCWYPCTKVYKISYRQAFTSCVCVLAYIVLLPLLVPGAVFFFPCLLIAYCASPQSFTMSWRNEATLPNKATRLGNENTSTETEVSPV